MKTYYLKYNIQTGTFIADKNRRATAWEEILVSEAKLNTAQIKALKEIVENKTAYRNRVPYIYEIQIEFERLFSICKTCDKVLYRAKHNKSWKGNCRECHQHVVKKKLAEHYKKETTIDK